MEPMDAISMTITLPTDLAAAVEGAVDHGHYASTSAVIREALEDWGVKQAAQATALSRLKADIAHGLNDVATGHLVDLDPARIAELGRQISTSRSRSD